MESKVRVIVRIRPFLPGENPASVCATVNSNRNKLLELSSTIQKTHYKFDSCYSQDAEQSEIFAEVSDSIKDVLNGINTTIFAYGMTGAGKTHTMQGKPDNPGIIPRVAQKLIEIVDKEEKNKYDMRLSYLEIYNEKVVDLLDPKEEDLNIRQDAKGEIQIPGLCSQKFTNVSKFDRIYRAGCVNRTTAPTGLNGESSRSHAILCIYVQHKQADKLITGKIHLIDLAGSEDNRYTQNTGLRMTESTNINKSLFVLGKVVNALNDGTRVPYRDSKLTRLLQDSLGGKSNAIMIANIAPGSVFFTETQRTLNFASKSRKIVNKPVVHAEAIQRAPDVDPAEERRRKLEEWRQKHGKEKKRKTTTTQATDKDKENQETPPPQPPSTTNPDKIQELLERMSSLLGTDSSNLEDRLQRIEKALKEKDANDAIQSTPPSIPLPMDISAFNPNSSYSAPLSLLTPSTKDRTAKGFLLAGREQEQRGQLSNALALYENAYRLMPDKNSRLATKIKKLKLQTTKSQSGGDVRAPAEGRPTLTPEQIAAQSEKVLHLINTGDVKQLSALHMIAEKRAKLIIAHRPFDSINDLEKVHGVGRRFVEKFYALNVTEAEL